MEQQSALDVTNTTEKQAEPEPQPQLIGSPVDDATKGSSKSKKKKKKNKKRRKSLEKTQSEVDELLDNQQDEQDDQQDEQDNQQDEVSIEQTSVKETVIESAVTGEETTKEIDVEEQQLEVGTTEQTTVKEAAVTKDTGMKEANEETVSVEKQQQELESATGGELDPPTLERTSSIDTLKATGTKAVGSLFSRFKVGRKKPSPSRTESAAKLEGVLPSPVKTAVKKFESPEEKNLDDLPMRTKRDFFGEGEQSVHVNAEKDKYDTLEKQRKEEKDAEEAAIAARRTPPSSAKSNEEVRTELEAAKEQIEAKLTVGSTETVEVMDKNIEKANAIDNSEVSTEDSTLTSSEVVEESITSDGSPSNSATVGGIESTGDKVDTPTEVIAQVVPEFPATTETRKPDESASTFAVVNEDDAKTQSDELDAGNPAVVSAEAEEDNPAVPESDIATQEAMETIKDTADIKKTESVSLKLDLNLEPVKAPAEGQQSRNDFVESTSPQSIDIDGTLQTDNKETKLTEEIGLLQPKVTPPTVDLPTMPVEAVKPEKMSPVKSLASRFEGKREQSLDNLKFRTVREFFPTERSIRVGAEKQKYEAQAQQQQMKAKAEEEAKAKYNTGPGIKSAPKEEAVPSPEVNPVAVESESKPADGDVGVFNTPETTSSRKKFSFDDGYASANSPSKFSDEALTPVKSIASRFEGKREQSLDNLKFRTVREFFPEERSVRVGSEKQKFEAQAQQDNSLDKLKFRTVREFFPEEGKRSIHVGAEKAKFEAITKQQEEAAKKAAEELKLKHIAPQTPETEKVDTTETSLKDDVENEASSPVVDTVVVGVSDPVVVEQVEESVVVKDDVDDEVPASEESTIVPAEKNEGSSATLTEIDFVSNEVQVQQSDESQALTEESDPQQNPNDGVEDGLAEPELKDIANSEKEEHDAAAKEEHATASKEELTDVEKEEPADVEVTEEPSPIQQTSTEVMEIEESQDSIRDEEPKASNDLVDLDLGEVAVGNSVELTQDGASDDVLVSEPLINVEEPMAKEEPVKIDGERIANSELVELDLSASVEKHGELNTAVAIESTKAGSSIDDQETVKNPVPEVEESVSQSDNGLVELDLGEPVVEIKKEQPKGPKSKRAILTTERSFVMEDHTIETEDTVVVGERPMTDGEDEFEPISPSKTRPAHELFAGITSPKSKKKSSTPKLTRKVSAGSVGSAKSPAKTTVPVPMKRASITAPTASYMAKKAAEAEELHRSSPQLKKKTSASKMKGTVSDTGFIKPQPAAPTVPVPMRRASITAPTASYTARRAAEEDAHKSSPQPKRQHSASKQKGTVSETGFIKPPPAAPTVPVPMKRASITAPTASWQARNTTETESEGHAVQKKQTPKQKGTVGPTGFVKPTPPPPTVPVAPKRASVMAPTASYRAKKAAELAHDVEIAPSAPARNKRYSNVKSKVVEGITTGKTHAVTHKIITKEEFIAAERRKSLGSAGVRSVLDAVDRRASLSANVTIVGPPEPFVRSAHSRKKLNSTVPRYMNYENTPGYAERAKVQFERRKRLEEENAAKSDKRQRELRMFFSERQQKSLMSSADEVRRGLEAHEFAKLAKESELEAQRALRRDKQLARSTRSLHRPSSASSSAGASSSNSATKRASKKSSVSSVSVEEKTVATPMVESIVVETAPVVESSESTTVMTEEIVEVTEGVAAVDQEAIQVEELAIPVPVVDEDPELEHVAKKIDFDEASSDSGEKDADE